MIIGIYEYSLVASVRILVARSTLIIVAEKEETSNYYDCNVRCVVNSADVRGRMYSRSCSSTLESFVPDRMEITVFR